MAEALTRSMGHGTVARFGLGLAIRSWILGVRQAKLVFYIRRPTLFMHLVSPTPTSGRFDLSTSDGALVAELVGGRAEASGSRHTDLAVVGTSQPLAGQGVCL